MRSKKLLREIKNKFTIIVSNYKYKNIDDDMFVSNLTMDKTKGRKVNFKRLNIKGRLLQIKELLLGVNLKRLDPRKIDLRKINLKNIIYFLKNPKELFSRKKNLLQKIKTNLTDRKKLPYIIGSLLILIPITYLTIKNILPVKAATMEISENDTQIQIDVPNRYRAILEKGDTNKFLAIYDRYENNNNPDEVLEVQSTHILDSSTDYKLEWDDNRRTNVLESTSTRIVIRIEGCFDTAAGGACLKDTLDGSDENLYVTLTYTFTPQGIYVNNDVNFKGGINIGIGEGITSLLCQFYGGTSHSATINYGNGSEESTSTGGNFETSPGTYAHMDGLSGYQDIICGESILNDDKVLSNSDSQYNWYASASDELDFGDRPGDIINKGYSSLFILLKPQSELDTEAEREGVFNSIINPDHFDYTTGGFWDDKPLTSEIIPPSTNNNGIITYDTYEPDANWGAEYSSFGFGSSGTYATDVVFDGEQSYRINTDTSPGYSWGYTDESTNDMSAQTIHFRLSLNVEEEVLDDGESFTLIRAEDFDNTQIVNIDFEQISGNYELAVRDADDTETDVGSDSRMFPNQWHTLEGSIFRDNTNGTINLWLDGVEVYNATGQNTGSDPTEILWVGIKDADTGGPHQLVIDNVIVSENKIGGHLFNEGEGAYAIDTASNNYAEFDLDAGANVSNSLSAAVLKSSTSVPLSDASDFPDGGGSTTYSAYIEGDKFTFNDVSGNNLLGIPSTGPNSVGYHASASIVSMPSRDDPFIKVRGYLNLNDPTEVSLEGERLRKDYDYIADVKPITRAYFADELTFHYMLDGNVGDVGQGFLTDGGGSHKGARYGNGFEINADGDDKNKSITTADYNKAKGTVEFWTQPYWDDDDSVSHYFFRMFVDSSNAIYLWKSGANNLIYRIVQGGQDIEYRVDAADFSWDAYDWLNVRLEWDDSEPIATQQRLYINGEELTHTDSSGTLASSSQSDYDTIIIGNFSTTGSNECNCLMDEFKIYTTDDVQQVASGGHSINNTDALTNDQNNVTLGFQADDPWNRAEYIYLGSDTKFSGVNLDLATAGVAGTTPPTFTWEYWSVNDWSTVGITVYDQESGTSTFESSGSFSFNPSADWAPYSVMGSPDLYYIRGHMESGLHSTSPIEKTVKTDILNFQFTRNGGMLNSQDLTFELPGWGSGAPPVAHWKFDEGYGSTVYDTTGNNNPLTITGASWSNEGLCLNGNCLQFGGDGDYASRTHDAELDFDENKDWTITGWFRHPSSVAATEVLVAKYETSGSDGGYKVYMNSSGQILFGVDDDNTFGPDDSASSSVAYNDNQWHHFGAVKTGTSKVELFIDGLLVDTDSSIAATATLENDDTFYIGIDGDGTSNDFRGFIDEVKVYRYARSADEIKTDHTKDGTVRGTSVAFSDDDSNLSDGLVSYWKMDEASWNGTTDEVKDSSGNGTHGTAKPTNSEPSVTTGKFGGGGLFDSSIESYIQITSSDQLNPGTGDFSLAAWVKTSETGATREIYEDTGGGDDLILIQINSFDNFRTNVTDQNDNSISVVGTTTAVTDTWYHILAVKKSQKLYLYVNGILEGQGENLSLGNVDVSGGNASIGAGGEGGNLYWDGTIDEVRTYNRALSATEAVQLYNWGPGPVAYYSFDEGSGTSTVYDRSGNGNNGTMGGSMTETDWVNGKYGNALDFDGSDDNVAVTDNDTMDFTTTESFTLESWFRKEPTEAADTTPGVESVSSIETFTTPSTSYTPMLGTTPMKITPGAGDYLVFFTATFGTDDAGQSNQWVKLYVNDVPQNHTERQVSQEGSMADAAETFLVPVSIVAEVLGVNDGEDIEIWWYSFDSTATVEERTLTVVPITDADVFTATATSAETTTSTSDVTVPGMTIDNPGAGDYLVWYTSSIQMTYTAPATTLYTSIYAPSGSQIAHSQRRLDTESSLNNIMFAPVTTFARLTNLGATDDIQVKWRTGASTQHINIEERTLVAYKIDEGSTFQTGITSNTTNTTPCTPYELIPSTSIPDPGAGNYMIFFSTSAETSSQANVDFALYTGGTKIDESQRTFFEDDSILNTYFPSMSTHAYKESLGATDDIEVYWQSDACNSSAYERTLIAFQVTGGGGGGSDAYTLLSKYEETGGDGGYKLLMETDGDITCGVDTDNSGFPLDFATTTAATYDDGNWYYAACVKDGSDSLKLFIDGVEIVSDTSLTASGSYANNDTAYIGIDGDGTSDGFPGSLDDMRIYNYARTDQQIIRDMNAGHPTPGSPVGSTALQYKFDSGFGSTAYDSSANSNDGTLGSGNSAPSWTTAGRFGRALSFDGTDDHVIAGSSTAIDYIWEDGGTISAWINVTSFGGGNYGRIADKGGGSTAHGWGVFVCNDGGSNCNTSSFALYYNADTGTDGWYSTPDNSISTGEWIHVAMTLNSNTVTNTPVFYLNGELVPTTVNTAWTGLIKDDSNYDLYIGDRLNLDRSFDGIIDDFRMYDSTLSADQIKVLYNQGFASVWGATSTLSGSAPSYSASREYCVPGDNSLCSAPVAYWDFNENTGTSSIYDKSGNSYTGTITGSITESDWINGISGSALNFSDSDDYINFGVSNFQSGDSQGSLTAWVYKNSLSTWSHFFNSGDSDADSYIGFAIEGTTGKPYIAQEDAGTGSEIIEAGTGIDAGVWTHLAFTSDGTDYRFFIDGKDAGYESGNGSGDWFADTSNMDNARIGRMVRNSGGWGDFDGFIDEVKVFDYPLTPAQVAWDYNKGAPTVHYKLDNCSGTTAYDSSGNEVTGTITPGSGANDSAGTCDSGAGDEMWDNGTTGIRNASLDFDGTDDYVAIADNDLLDYGQGDFSFSLWVKTSQTCTGNKVWWGQRSGTDPTIWIGCHATGNTVGYDIDSDTVEFSNQNGTTSINDDEWHHVVVVKKGHTSAYLYLYVDGVLEKTTGPRNYGAGVFDFASGSTINAIGRLNVSPYYYPDAQIDEVKIFRYALTAEQVLTDYRSGSVNFGY